MFIKNHKKAIIVLTTTAMMALSAATAFAATGGGGASLAPASGQVDLSNVTKGTFNVAGGTLKTVTIVKNGDGIVVQSVDGQTAADFTTADGLSLKAAGPLKISGALKTADLKEGTFTVVEGLAPQISGSYTTKAAPAKQ